MRRTRKPKPSKRDIAIAKLRKLAASWRETRQLLKSPENACRLRAAIKEFE
jgi:PHD/YefM family antitoxin component YafN of YafNO toxin-antitoxin module